MDLMVEGVLPASYYAMCQRNIFIEAEDVEFAPLCFHMFRVRFYLFAFHPRGRLENQSEHAEVAVTLYCALNMNPIPGIDVPPGDCEVKRNEINSCSDTRAHSIIHKYTRG